MSIASVTYTWNAAGGILINSGAGTNTVSVSPLTGTTYGNGYSKYAKGKLILDCHVVYSYKYYYSNCNGGQDSAVHTYAVDYSDAIEIRKIFDMPDGLVTNAIVGPECVLPGDSITYSVAPWVSLYQMNQVGFDTYNWTIPTGVNAGDLYYSADSSSVTFRAGTDVAGKTLSVTMGRCNTSQTPLTFTLGQEPADPIFKGADLADYCLPFGIAKDTIIITNPQPAVTYTWDLRSWTANHISAKGDTVIYTPLDNAQTITMKMSGGCADKTFIYDINRSLSPSSAITTQYKSCLPKNSNVKFSIPGVPVGTEMAWSLDATAIANGWTLSAAEAKNATPIIHVGTGVGRVYAETADCGSTSIYGDFKIKVSTPTAINASSTCLARTSENLTFGIPTANLVAGAEGYNWQIPSTWVITSASFDSTSVSVSTDGATAGSIKVRAHGCDTSAWYSLALNLVPEEPDNIVVPSTCISSGMADTITLSVNTVVPNQMYSWIIPSTWSIISSTSNNTSITIETDGVDNTYTVGCYVTNPCGSSDTTEVSLTIAGMNLSNITQEGNSRCWYYHLAPNGWNPGDCVIKWVLNGSTITYGSYQLETDCTDANLIGSPSNTFHVTVTDTVNHCTTRRVLAGSAFRSASISSSVKESVETEQTISVYPNPANSVLNVVLPSDESASISLIDISGKVVERLDTSSNRTRINVSSLSNGLYIISVNQNGKQFSKRILIKK